MLASRPALPPNVQHGKPYADGSEECHGEVIEFYVSDLFRKKVKPVPAKHGEVIEFPKAGKKSA